MGKTLEYLARKGGPNDLTEWQTQKPPFETSISSVNGKPKRKIYKICFDIFKSLYSNSTSE